MDEHSMRNMHIAIVNLPHPPHVNPTLPIVSVMVRRGYRVTYVTSERFAPQISVLGAEVVQCSPFTDIPRSTELMLAEITPFYEKHRPDLMIYDFMALAGRILAHRWHIRAIQTSPDFVFENRSKLIERISDEDVQRRWREHYAKIDNYLRRYGIADGSFPLHEKLNIHFAPRTFQPSRGVFGPEFFHAGRCAGEQQPYGKWHRDDVDERPIVLLGTSTTYTQGADYFSMCIEALRGLDCHIIIYAGDKFDDSCLTSLPAHCEVVRGTAQVKLLCHASLLICHGGIITPAEAAYYGVPLLMVTHGNPELELWADIFASEGFGVHLRGRNINAENMRQSATLLMTDKGMLRNVTHIRNKIRREPGAEETVNRIEEYIET